MNRDELKKLNEELARALGVGDLKHVTGITLTLSPSDWPTVEVRKYLLNGDQLQTAVHMLQLKPVDARKP